MISLMLASVISLHGAATTVTLVRGGTVGDLPIWDVEDTTLDGGSPNANHGGDAVLSGGSSRRVLIRFGDISRVVPLGQKVKSATLVMTPTGGGRPGLQTISVVRAPWGEGPYQTLAALTPKLPTTTPDGKPVKAEEPVAPRGSATWRQRRAGNGGENWQQPGAGGPNDTTPIDGAKLSQTDSEVRIDGLTAAVQNMADRPYENFGFAISFDGSAEVGSSQSVGSRPRLEIELEDAPVPAGPDLAVVSIQRVGPSGKLPNPGETAKFVATIRNEGSADATGFSATWSFDEHPGGAQDNTQTLKPGQQTTITYETSFRPDKDDHRFQAVGITITPKDADTNPRNNGLKVTQGAKPIEVGFDGAAYTALTNLGVKPEDWVQETARLFNDVYLAQSRYSFAPDGALERIAIQKIYKQSEPGAGDGSARVLISSLPDTLPAARRYLLQQFAVAAGLTDRSATNVSAADNAMSGLGAEDRFPGLLGYGDTRFEGFVPGSVGLPYAPYPSPLVDAFPLESTGLLSATDVATLNASLGGTPVEVPKAIVLRAADFSGVPLLSTELTFFQLSHGKLAKDATSAFTAKTGSGGTALLAKPDDGLFPEPQPGDGSGAYLVRATANGVSAYCWLKDWQLMDAASRGSRAAAIIDLRFPLPGATLDMGTDLSADRIVTDSSGSAPAQLAALIDGQNATASKLPSKAGDWVEIDLGRDRVVGEVSLVAKPGDFWSRYDLMTYATGQRPEEAIPWSQELDGPWTFRNRRELLTGSDLAMVRYPAQPRRFRYLRLVNRAGGEGSLSEIRITPAVVNP